MSLAQAIFIPFLGTISLRHEDIREAQWLQVRKQFLFNLRFEDCWRGSNWPPRDSSQATLTDEGIFFFPVCQHLTETPKRMLLTTGEGRPRRITLLAQQNDQFDCIISTWICSLVRK